MSDFEQILHHGKKVWVRTQNKGLHRDICLCYNCKNFHPGMPETNCKIANLLYAIALAQDVVIPVLECPVFDEGPKYKFTTPSMSEA